MEDPGIVLTILCKW